MNENGGPPHPGLSLQFHGTPSSRQFEARKSSVLRDSSIFVCHALQFLDAIFVRTSTHACLYTCSPGMHKRRQLFGCLEAQIERGSLITQEVCKKADGRRAGEGFH